MNQNTLKNDKYMRILEADTFKWSEMKEEHKTRTTKEIENFLKPNSVVEISSKK